MGKADRATTPFHRRIWLAAIWLLASARRAEVGNATELRSARPHGGVTLTKSWPTVLCRKACRRQNVGCLRTLAPLLNFRGDAAVAARMFPVAMPSSKRWQARAGRAEPMPSPCIGAQMHQESIHKFRRGRGLRSATTQRSACTGLRQHYGFVSDVVWLAAVGSWSFLPPRDLDLGMCKPF